MKPDQIPENGRHSHEPVSAAATTWPQEPRVGSAEHASDREQLMRRWDRIQAGFVDDPQRAVVEAEQLADQLLAQVRDALERERSGIVRAGHAQGASTEDLRMCVKRYRALIDRLVAFV